MAPNTKHEDHPRQKREKSSRYSLRAADVPVSPVEPRTRDPDHQIKAAKKRQISRSGHHRANSKYPNDGQSPAKDRLAEDGCSQAPLKDSEQGERVEEDLSLSEDAVLELEKVGEMPPVAEPGRDGARAQVAPISRDLLLDPLGLFDSADEALEFYY